MGLVDLCDNELSLISTTSAQGKVEISGWPNRKLWILHTRSAACGSVDASTFQRRPAPSTAAAKAISFFQNNSAAVLQALPSLCKDCADTGDCRPAGLGCKVRDASFNCLGTASQKPMCLLTKSASDELYAHLLASQLGRIDNHSDISHSCTFDLPLTPDALELLMLICCKQVQLRIIRSQTECISIPSHSSEEARLLQRNMKPGMTAMLAHRQSSCLQQCVVGSPGGFGVL